MSTTTFLNNPRQTTIKQSALGIGVFLAMAFATVNAQADDFRRDYQDPGFEHRLNQQKDELNRHRDEINREFAQIDREQERINRELDRLNRWRDQLNFKRAKLEKRARKLQWNEARYYEFKNNRSSHDRPRYSRY